MTLKTIAKKINKKLEKELAVEEFDLLGSLSQESLEKISKKIEESILIPLELHVGS